MSYDSLEIGTETSKPIELYEFSYQNVVTRWTSADREILLGPSLYRVPTGGISRSDIEDAGKNVSNPSITLTVRNDFAPIQVFSAYPPSDVVNLTIKRLQSDDTSEVITIWSGRVLSVGWGVEKAKVTCQNIFTRLKQPGLRRLYGANCPHLLYSQGDGECKLSRAAFKVTATLTTVDGLALTSAAFDALPDGHFAGGLLDLLVSPGIYDKRGIKTHVGDTITLTHPLAELVAGIVVDVYPGCDKTQATCITKFNNVVNFGGFPYTPKKNPFGTDTVF